MQHITYWYIGNKILKIILFDSGCGATLAREEYFHKLPKESTSNTTWATKAGSFTTTQKCKCKFLLPEFHAHRVIEWDVYVDDSKPNMSQYDMIIGRNKVYFSPTGGVSSNPARAFYIKRRRGIHSQVGLSAFLMNGVKCQVFMYSSVSSYA